MISVPAESSRRRVGIWRRVGVLGIGTALFLGIGAGVAFAHVTVNPKSATAGSYTPLTFRFPTESDTASTVSIALTIPTDRPFASVSTRQMPGWTATMTKVALNPPVTEGRFNLDEVVSAVTWTADDGVGIKPGEFAEFALSVGPIPDVPSMFFPATQTYSDGAVVIWDGQSSDDGGSAPEHPAPMLTIEKADAAGTILDASSESSSDTTAQILGLTALILAAIALVVAVAGRRRATVSAVSGPATSCAPSSPTAGGVPADNEGSSDISPSDGVTK